MPSSKPILGVNDLQSKFPEIAAEAYGWDPATVVAGSHQKKSWKCNLGHTWDATISDRTFSNTGCPICSNRQLLAGFNDLQTKFPKIAAEANGWDPATVVAGSHQKKSWICNLGHIWDAALSSRTSKNAGCPICCNRQVLAGFNDLQSKFPEIAAEANGWDPSTIAAGSHQKKSWICNLGHTWDATIGDRTFSNAGCPICCNRQVLAGFNDLQSKFPEIAAEANGWDPSTVIAGSNKKKSWICNLGHTWDATANSRTTKNTGCPICSNQKLLAGFNDLQAKFPKIAAEANGWDPTTVIGGSNKKMSWKCNLGHTWDATISDRTFSNTGCPICSNRQLLAGFNDLQTKFPKIAAEANGWDPTTVIGGSNKKMSWKCNLGHIWDAALSSRTSKNTGCPICSNQKLLAGFNDLQAKFPKIAAEANGWDPSTIAAGSHQKKSWICNLGHAWDTTITNRTSHNTGCPICSNKQVLAGFNDLQAKFPEIAAEAYGWDPATVVAGSHQKKSWICNLGHTWDATIGDRTFSNTGCPICSNRQLLAGFNDLQTKFPKIAAEANGWDPATVVAGSDQKKSWICNLGHTWDATIGDRTFSNTGCPICSNRQLLAGFNDLQTKFPKIAAEANGWDPSTIAAGSHQKKSWICNLGHAWDTTITNRTSHNTGCPICSNKQVLAGFNDLQAKFPEIAAEAYGWDPATVVAGSRQKKSWICDLGHTWDATISDRTFSNTGCPTCAEYGFNPGKNACFYLMRRPGEQQLGITNDLKTRLQVHERNGWVLLEHTEPAQGEKVWKIEAALKKWLKKNIGVIEGTTENWATTSMKIQSLAELKARSGIETDLF